MHRAVKVSKSPLIDTLLSIATWPYAKWLRSVCKKWNSILKAQYELDYKIGKKKNASGGTLSLENDENFGFSLVVLAIFLKFAGTLREKRRWLERNVKKAIRQLQKNALLEII